MESGFRCSAGHQTHRPVKALNQGKAKARVPPTLILQAKAKRAKKAKRARRVKRVQTPKATRAKKDRRVNMPGPSWKVARVQPKGTQNDRFSPSFLPLPPVSFFPFLPPLPIRFTASCLFFPSFSCLLIRFLSPTGLSRSFRPTRSLASPPLFATTQSVIPAHSVYCVFSFSLSLASVQLGLSRSFRPTQSLVASVLAFTSLFYAFPPLPRLSQSFRLTRSLAISSPFLASALPLF